MNKLLMIFSLGLVEQFGYTLYIISVTKYLILMSSVILVSYMFVYLFLIDRIAKDKNDSLKLAFAYALACGIGNFIAMALKLIK
jgi:hypothetical protein